MAAIITSLAGAGCASSAGPPPIIWIVVDSLRADHLEWYGYGRATSPHLRPLVEQGVLFENAYTPQPQTTPAIASMLTGLYPARHGVRQLYLLLHDQNRTAAELLAPAGYETAAFVSSFVMVRDFSNLGQGFAVYDDFVSEREQYRDNYERKAAATLERADRWLRQRQWDRPFFLFVHLIDPHGPYAAPGGFAGRFRSRDMVEVAGDIPAGQQIPGVRDLNRYLDGYDGEIASVDEALGRFLGLLQQRGLFDRSLILFTADHGESMGEHGLYFTHGQDVFQETVRVPLIIKMPGGGSRGGLRVADPVSHVDLLPTVLELAGVPVPAALDGRTLAPLLRGEAGEPRGVFAAASGGQASYLALVEDTRKTVLRIDPDGKETLSTYDLAADPRETLALPAQVAAAERLSARRRAWDELRLPFEVTNNFMPLAQRERFVRGRQDPRLREDAQRLRSLGYIE